MGCEPGGRETQGNPPRRRRGKARRLKEPRFTTTLPPLSNDLEPEIIRLRCQPVIVDPCANLPAPDWFRLPGLGPISANLAAGGMLKHEQLDRTAPGFGVQALAC